jgi:hypothetical protein
VAELKYYGFNGAVCLEVDPDLGGSKTEIDRRCKGNESETRGGVATGRSILLRFFWAFN